LPTRDNGGVNGGVLAVHAHPDDETLATGATLAHYAARGVPVTLVTCTRGECGEVIPPGLAHLEGDLAALAAHRTAELAEAMRRLGVGDHVLLGAPVTGVQSRFAPRVYHDSGMAYGPDGGVIPAPSSVAGALAAEDPDEQAERLAEIILARRPRAVLTYDPGGGYGHPDHVRVHQVTTAAVALVAERGGPAPKLYWTALPASEAAAHRRLLAGQGRGEWRVPAADEPFPSMVMPDEVVTSVIGGSAALRRVKAHALRAHATQVSVADDDETYALSNGVAHVLTGREWFRLVSGEPGGERDADDRETDLLA
jgi:N-acetyl-1-D-myo-inositol-2-amino-2-deoxy-alpha-D-glucopyranoside deacetylase